MKKVVQIGGNLGINGISSFIMENYRQLHNEYQFIFINTADEENGYYTKEIQELGGKIYHVHSNKKGPFRSLDQAKKIRKIIKKENPIAIHSHYFSNNGIYLKQAFKENINVRISHCHNAKSNLTFSKKIAINESRKLISEYSTNSFACSKTARKFLYKNDGIVLYNSIDYSKHYKIDDVDYIYSKYSLNKNIVYVCFVGRMSEQKNPDFLLEIIEANKDICFILITYGKLLDSFKTKVNELKLINVIYLPKDSNVNEIMNISSCLLLPSLYEGFPIVTIEAQACGIPCLISNNVSKECDLGECQFLDLKLDKWSEAINGTIKQERKPIYFSDFDVKFTSIILGYLYDGLSSDDFIQLGKEYSLGSKRVLRSKELSYLCFKMAHFLGNVKGTFYYALAHFEGNGTLKDKVKANEILTEIWKEKIIDNANKEMNSNLNNPTYLVIYADMYSFGLGEVNDFAKAFELYQKAANLGNLEAMCDLGYMYLVGQGVNKDEEKSAYWFKKSADLGYVHSMRDIGQNYLHGQGVTKNVKVAKEYFKLASEHNYSHGTVDLARCLIDENGENDTIVSLLLLALKQDYERTFRDLIELGIDIKSLKEKHKFVKTNITEINDINETNSCNGCLCVSTNINKIDPNCFYSHKEIFKIFVEKSNETYSSINGVLYSKDKKILVRYPIGLLDETLIVPDGVEIIGEHAIQNARNLKKIVLPESIKIIKNSAFDDCKSLEEINLPNNITEIGDWSFHGCDKLKNIKLPSELNELGTYPFGSCESLENIFIDEKNRYFKTIDGILYSKDMTALIQYPIGKKIKRFVIPNTVKTLKFRCFSDGYYLEYVDARNVNLIEEKVFYYCTNLMEVILNFNVQLKGQKIFDHTSNHLMIEREK